MAFWLNNTPFLPHQSSDLIRLNVRTDTAEHTTSFPYSAYPACPSTCILVVEMDTTINITTS